MFNFNMNNSNFNIMDRKSIFDIDNNCEPEETYLSFENFNHMYPNAVFESKIGNLSFLNRNIMRTEQMISSNEINDEDEIKAIKNNFCLDKINEENNQIIHSPNQKDENRINQDSTSKSNERKNEENKEEGKNSQQSVLIEISSLSHEIELEENNEEEIPDISPKKAKSLENGNDKEGGRYNEILFQTKTNQIPGRKPRDKEIRAYIKKRHKKCF